MAVTVTFMVSTTDGYTQTDYASKVKQPTDWGNAELAHIENFFAGLRTGRTTGTLYADVASAGLVAATGTATLASVVATDKLTINGVDFTAVASGATGNQFNVGVDDTATAANLAAAVNASTTSLVQGYVTATSAAAVVTVTAMMPGLCGNTQTLAQTGGHITLSASRLTGGTGGNSTTGFTTYSLI